MRILLIFFSFIFCTKTGTKLNNQAINRILGGREAYVGQFPFQVAVLYSWNFLGGGVIITEKNVLTAAHVVAPPHREKFFSLRVGSLKSIEGGIEMNVSKIISHPNYNGITFDNDISLFILESKIQFSSTIQSIKLPDTQPAPGSLIFVSGWGKLENQSTSDVLMFFRAPLIDTDNCQKYYEEMNLTYDTGDIVKVDNNRHLCAGSKQEDKCAGDSGGGMIMDGILIGIVSFGVPNCGGISVYTNVFYYYDWIKSQIEKPV